MSGRRRAGRTSSSGTWLVWASVPALIFLVLPVVVVIPMSLTPRRYIEFPPSGISFWAFQDFFSDPQWTGAAWISLRVAVLAAIIAVIAGATAAIAMHRSTAPGRSTIIGVILVPLAIPTVALGIADYRYFIDIGLSGSVVAIAAAHAVIVTPFVYINVAVSLGGLQEALVRSARSLGASRLAVLRDVYWPVIRPGAIGGAAIAFAVSFDEAVIAYFLQAPGATTLPVTLFSKIQYDLTPVIAAVSTMLIIIVAILLTLYAIPLMRRRSPGQVREPAAEDPAISAGGKEAA